MPPTKHEVPMSYTPTPPALAAPLVIYKHKSKAHFTHSPSASASGSAMPKPTGLSGQPDVPYGAILVILFLLYMLSRINKKKKQHNDTDYTGIQMHQLYTLDPVRRRRI